MKKIKGLVKILIDDKLKMEYELDSEQYFALQKLAYRDNWRFDETKIKVKFGPEDDFREDFYYGLSDQDYKNLQRLIDRNFVMENNLLEEDLNPQNLRERLMYAYYKTLAKVLKYFYDKDDIPVNFICMNLYYESVLEYRSKRNKRPSSWH